MVLSTMLQNMEKAMTAVIDMAGQKYERLAVLHRDPNRSGRVKWICLCDCGATVSVDGKYLRNGRIKSCGCYAKDKNTSHGMSRTRTYHIWQNMKDRVRSPKAGKSRNYRERGITVADRWQQFENFLADMGEAPDGMSIDRIDNDKGYEPGNCRWATAETQANNMRTTVFLEHDGERLSLSQWARKLGVSRSRLAYRLSKGHPPSFILS